jgi:iron complex transport system substrate-binding protein
VTPLSGVTRRQFLGLAGAAGLTLTAACSRGGGGERAGSGGVVIKHVFGETTLSAPPTRVVSAGLTEQDDLLAVGVGPVAVTKWIGDQPVWPWEQPKLGSATPAVLTLDNGIQINAIAQLKPDLIVAINAGLDADTYTKLSAIAPTIAQSGEDAFFEPWKDQAATIGTAVFKKDEMATAVDAVEQKFAAVAQANPTFKDRTAVLLNGFFTGDTVTATVAGWRTEFLTAMGLTVPESVKGFASGDYAMISRRDLPRALGGADLLIWCTDRDAEQAALLADPAVAELRRQRSVFTPAELSAAIAYASPLSYPVVAEQLPPLLRQALG